MTDNRIKMIADTNGFKVICNKLTEEAGELTTAIARFQSKWVDTNNEKEELGYDLDDYELEKMTRGEMINLLGDL